MNDKGVEASAAPYPRSWVDALIAWIERLPGPAWLFYLLATVVLVVVGTALTWLEGSQPFGTFTFIRVYNDAFVVYPLAVIHLLKVAARSSFAAFRPALGDLDSDYDRLVYEFTNLRRSTGVVLTIIGAGYVASALAFDDGTVGISEDTSVFSWIFVSLVGLLAGVLFLVLVFYVLRQLVLIVRLHSRATNISLYDAHAHSAFARLTLPSSIALALPVYVYTSYAILVGSPREGITVTDLIAVIAMITGAIGVFFIPLIGIHNRLVAEKAKLVAAVNVRFSTAALEVHAKADAKALDGIGDLNTLLSALGTERETVKKLSTWPWEAETLRGFLSSIALPILLWLITTLLSRLFGA